MTSRARMRRAVIGTITVLSLGPLAATAASARDGHWNDDDRGDGWRHERRHDRRDDDRWGSRYDDRDRGHRRDDGYDRHRSRHFRPWWFSHHRWHHRHHDRGDWHH